MVPCGGAKTKGKVTRNAFFNFLREFRRNNPGKSITETAKLAGACWRKMSPVDKEPFCKMAASAPKMARRSKSRSRSKSSHCKSKRKRGSRSKSRRTGCKL
ncbi:hypothetical protein RI129_000533 [Pyrocoelia pectoralis]|uniref:HMG box domain-containing protein n=1 Tax=Pyrocoelia pectoralis TaxID=417401 RepID=A0AAN7VU61_9COLE